MSKLAKPGSVFPGKFKHTIRGRLAETLDKQDSDFHRDLTGKVLIIIDASVSDLTQRKAIKDLMNGVLTETFRKKMYATEDSLRQAAVFVGDAERPREDSAMLSGPNEYYNWVQEPEYNYTRTEKA